MRWIEVFREDPGKMTGGTRNLSPDLDNKYTGRIWWISWRSMESTKAPASRGRFG